MAFSQTFLLNWDVDLLPQRARQSFLEENGIGVKVAKKIGEGVPNVLDVIRSGICDLIIDIPQKGNDKGSDGFKIRRCASGEFN